MGSPTTCPQDEDVEGEPWRSPPLREDSTVLPAHAFFSGFLFVRHIFSFSLSFFSFSDFYRGHILISTLGNRNLFGSQRAIIFFSFLFLFLSQQVAGHLPFPKTSPACRDAPRFGKQNCPFGYPERERRHLAMSTQV